MLHYTFFSRPSPLWDAVIALRMQVFVQEMAIPSTLELDQYDTSAIHLSVRDNEQTIGTLRLIRVETKEKQTKAELPEAQPKSR